MKRKEHETTSEGKRKKFDKELTSHDGKKIKNKKTIEDQTDKETVKNPKFSKDNEKRGKYEKPLAKKSAPLEKPDWLEFKKKKKELKETRRAKRLTNVYDVSVKAKKISEKLRRSDCTDIERKKLILKVHSLLETHYNKMIFTHDMSRIIQWLLKYGDLNIRLAIFGELKPSLVTMLQSKYAKNCLKVLLKHGSKEVRSEIVSTCYGNVVNLTSHSVSASLLELIYSNWATDVEKQYLKQEFYGDMYKQAKDEQVKQLSDVYKVAKAMKSATLTAVKGNLLRILNKKLINSTLVQLVLWEFLNDCSAEDRNDLIAMLRDFIVELSRTKIGSRVAALCVWHGTNKDRKHIMKTLKDDVKTISMSEHGYIVLLSLLDSVDDTVLLKKIVLSQIQKEWTELALNEYGKHVILYLVARRNSHYFPPSIVEFLEQGDNNATSKKPADTREKELLESVSNSLLETVAANAPIWMSSSSVAMVTLAVLKVGSGEKLKQAFESIASFVADPTSKIKEGNVDHQVAEYAGLHMVLKKLVQNDKSLQERGECTFGEILVDRLTREVIETWIEFNRGCFLLVFLMENETESTVNILISKLKPIVSVLKNKSYSGAKILLRNLNDRR